MYETVIGAYLRLFIEVILPVFTGYETAFLIVKGTLSFVVAAVQSA
jgi:hypothetical protein